MKISQKMSWYLQIFVNLFLLYIAGPHDHQAEGLEELVEEEVVSENLFIQYCLFYTD